MPDPYFSGTLELAPYVGPLSPYPTDEFPGLMLKRDFEFHDSRGEVWSAHMGEVVNGASIPQIFKPLIGHSYDSPYLAASVFHDLYGRTQLRSKADTDKMFYEAMRTNGVNRFKAFMMYSAVALFGPKW